MQEDGLKVLELPVVEGVQTPLALRWASVWWPNRPSLLPQQPLEHTGNFHLVSHSALMPSWCGMRAVNASSPICQCREGPPACVILCGDMVLRALVLWVGACSRYDVTRTTFWRANWGGLPAPG